MNIPTITCAPIFWTLLIGITDLYLHSYIHTLEA
jgi:hypothetical protein